MTEMVLDIQTLPETIFSKIPTKKVKVYEANGTITVTPFSEEKPRFDHLIGIFSDGKISIDDFLEEKQRESICYAPFRLKNVEKALEKYVSVCIK